MDLTGRMQPFLILLIFFIKCCPYSSGNYVYTADPPVYQEHASDGLDEPDESNMIHTNHEPYFETMVPKNVTALAGKIAYLHCRIRNLRNHTVSWIRHRGLHLLTTGRTTYTSDQRFQCIHNPQTEEWTLQIRYAQHRDSGTYECQVSTTPPVGQTMSLLVVEPITTIIGGPDVYINTGSTLNITCIVQHSPGPPPQIFWTHDNQEINYDSPRGGVSVITEKGDITTSYLLIQRARAPDSGKYTCSPSNANPRTVVVHVLNGEQPAAIQLGVNLKVEQINLIIVFVSVIIALYTC